MPSRAFPRFSFTGKAIEIVTRPLTRMPPSRHTFASSREEMVGVAQW
jgi:hypothetical protein